MNTAVYRVLKMLIIQFLLISVCVLLGMGLMSLILKDYDSWGWYMPFQILLVSLLTSLASLVYVSKKELSKKEFIIRGVIHFILLLIIVYTLGYFFKWWSEWSGILIVFAIFITVYLIVFITTYMSEKKDSNKINEALKNFHDAE